MGSFGSPDSGSLFYHVINVAWVSGVEVTESRRELTSICNWAGCRCGNLEDRLPYSRGLIRRAKLSLIFSILGRSGQVSSVTSRLSLRSDM